MVMSMKESGKMTKLTAMELIHTEMVQGILELGKMTNSMVKDKKLGLMVPNMKVNTMKERNMVKENYYLLMALLTMESLI